MKELQEILDVTRLKLDRHENLFITPKFDVSLIVNSINDFISIPTNEYLLLFADLSNSSSKHVLYITNKSIIRISDHGASEIALQKIQKLMLDDSESHSLMLNNTRFFDFPDQTHMAEVVIEFLADLQNINISSLDPGESEIRYPKFSDILNAVIAYYEKKKDSTRLEQLYFKLSDSEFKPRIEAAIQEVKKSKDQTDQWEFFDEDGVKFYTTDKIKDVAKKMKSNEIKPDHLVLRNGVGEMKPVQEVISKSDPKLKSIFHPFTRIRNSSIIVGGIVGLITGIIYFFMLQDELEVKIEFIVTGLVLVALGFISWEISKRKTHPAFKWVGVSLPIAGAVSILYGSAWFLITVLSFTAGIAILSLAVGWIIYKRNKDFG